MDFWNRKKVRELEIERKRLIDDRDAEIKKLKSEIDGLEKRLRGDRVCDGYCQLCEHGIMQEYTLFPNDYPVESGVKFSCALDCKCKDFKKREGQ